MSPSTLTPPEMLAPAKERYEILDLLGRGGMGEVYKAWDAELEVPVALKALRASVASDPRVLARFKREAKLARRIKHVHVAQMHDLVEWRGQRYLCMEFVEGQSIKSLLTRKARFPVHVALALIRQTCAGLQAAHEEGVIHRDLKPQNVMVTRRTGRACILDFGIARDVGDDEMTEAGVILGSPQYMSYEQIAGLPVGMPSDIYQLGLLLYEMVTGVSPFRAPGTGTAALRALREVPPDPRTIEPRLPASVAEIILRCLQKWPSDRFPSARAMLSALEALDAAPRHGAESIALAQPPVPEVELDGGTVAVSAAPSALVALNSQADRQAVVDRLGKLGCTVTLARDGTDALRRAHAETFALVILGATLAGVDGLTACQVLRQSIGGATPVLVVLDAGDEGRTAFAHQAGASAVLRAPLNVHALSRTVRDLVKV